MKSDVNISVK